MKKKLVNMLLFIVVCSSVVSQEQLEIEGAIIIKNSEDQNPSPGTIRFNSSTDDFEGWNGHQWMSLTRLREPGGGVTDQDGNTYTTLKLGTQEWMVENLKTSKYCDNVGIPNITGNSDWSGLMNSETGAWCHYENNTDYAEPYGKLYNWYAVQTGKLCPTGWHVPSDAEWTVLTDHLGGQSIAGGKMKEGGTVHWMSPNVGATNESGLGCRPGGFRSNSGSFGFIGKSGYYWSNSVASSTYAWQRNLFYNDFDVGRNSSQKRSGHSVRCVKN